MSESALEPTLEDIAAAMTATDGKPPTAVLDAFIPSPTAHSGFRLLPLRAGHELLLAQLSHPLSTGEKWDSTDILVAFFVFTHPSDLLFEMVGDDTFQAGFIRFVHELPVSATDGLGEKLISHWLKSRNTALAMESEHGGGKKKAVGSGGYSPRSAWPARFTAGFLRKFFMKFRWLKFWP